MTTFTESTIEEATLDWLAKLGFAIAHGLDIAPGDSAAEHAAYGDAVFVGRLRSVIERIISKLPKTAIDDVVRRVLSAGHLRECRSRRIDIRC